MERSIEFKYKTPTANIEQIGIITVTVCGGVINGPHSWGPYTDYSQLSDWIELFYSLRNLFKIMLSTLHTIINYSWVVYIDKILESVKEFEICTHTHTQKSKTYIHTYLYSCIWYGEWRHFVYIVMAMESVTRCKISGTSGSMDWTVLEWAVRWNFHNFECWDTDRGRPKLT